MATNLKTGIPSIIIEEHNEAFYCWNYAIQKGIIPPTENTLLHIDEHSDMSSGRFNLNIDELNGNLDEIRRFTYSELTIDSFISSAIYKKIFSNLIWIRQKHEGDMLNQKIPMYIRSYNNMGKKLMIGRERDTDLHKTIRQDDNIRYFGFYRKHIDEINDEQDLVLDIDLDFFSCSGNPNKDKEMLIEISPEEFNRYLNDPYHRMNYMFGRVEVLNDKNRFYYVVNNYAEIYPVPTHVDEETIMKRIIHFIAILKREEMLPSMICICRSRFSGFTPSDQWNFIETHLLEELKKLFPLTLIPYLTI